MRTVKLYARESVVFDEVMVVRDAAGLAIDISGWNFIAQLTRAAGTVDVALATVAAGAQGFTVVNGPLGQLRLRIAAATLAGIDDTTGFFTLFGDLLATPPGLDQRVAGLLRLTISTAGEEFGGTSYQLVLDAAAATALAEINLAVDRAELAAGYAATAQSALADSLTGSAGAYAAAMAEFANGELGCIGVLEPEWCFTDAAMLNPVTAPGQQVLKIKNPTGNAIFDMEPIGTPGTLERALGKWYLKYDNSEGYRSVGTFGQKVPTYQAIAAALDHDVDGRYIFGTTKNTNTRFMISSTSNARVSGDVEGLSTDPVRPWVQSFTPNYSVPEPGPVTVIQQWVDEAGFNNINFENSTVVNNETRKPTAWVAGDEVTGMRLYVNGGGAGVANVASSGEIWGWFFIHDGLPQRPDKVAEWLQRRSRPEMSSYSRVEMIIADSLNDGTDTEGGDYGREGIQDLAADYYPAEYPDSAVVLQDFNAEGDCFRGPTRSGNVAALKRMLLIGATRAGSGPDYFIGERHGGLIDDVYRMDRIGTIHGHNLAVTDGVIVAHSKRKYYRLGHLLTQQDFYRSAFPSAQHWMVKEHPANLPGDIRIDSYNEAVDFLKSRYFPDIAVADFYTPAKAEFDAKFAASLVSDWTIGDRIHLRLPTGIDPLVSVMEATLDAMPLTQRVAPPILKVRPAILPSANLLPNGDYSQWSGGLTTGWTVWGDAVVSQDGGMVKVSSAGHGGIECTISAIALRDKIVTLNAVMEIAESVNLNAGGVSFLTDKIGSNIGDGRWFQAPYRCYDALRGFTHLFPVDAEGTEVNAGKPSILTVRIAAASNFNGGTGAGEIRLARSVLVEGDEPRDLVGAALALPPSAVAKVSSEPVYSQISILPDPARAPQYLPSQVGTVTQLTSRTTAVTLNKLKGEIALFSAANSTSYITFTVNNAAVDLGDAVQVWQVSGVDIPRLTARNVTNGSFQISLQFNGSTVEAPVLGFAVTKA